MTKEEAITILIREIDEDPFLRTEYREKIHEALKMGIKALEQMDVLAKIRAEIVQAIREETVCDTMGGEYERIVSTIDPDDVLEIIDKYREEQE